MPNDAAVVWGWLCDGYRPDPPYTVSQWADKNRRLSSKASAEPGQWRTARTPYLREIMDELSAYSSTELVAVMKGAQIGMSEAGLNFVGYAIHHAPGPTLYVMPTVDTVKKLSKQRLAPMIEASPALLERIPPARSRDSSNALFEKEFPGGVLLLAGANSAAGLRSMPIRYLVLDEVDGYPADVDEEGDPVQLAIKRTDTFSARRKIFMLSTPAVKGRSRIGTAFREGDQRYYNVACEKCGTLQPIKWGAIKWPKGQPEKAAFECQAADPETGELCGHLHTESRKLSLIDEANGAKWIPTAESLRPRRKSYHLSALYSPWKTWGECAQEFLGCHGADDRPDPARLQVWVNTVLGEEWEEAGEGVDSEGLAALREEYGPVLPPEVTVLTGGIDVQADRLELEVVGWGADEESWSIDYQVFVGDPSKKEVWDQLDEYRARRWAHPGLEDGLKVRAWCIDTGGANTRDVYAYVKKNEAQRVWGIKGSSVASAPIWPKKPTRSNRGKINLFVVGASAAKEAIYKRLGRVGPNASGAGACHFPMDRDAEYFAQLTREVRRTKYINGFPVTYWWKPDGSRNEALDCRVYAYAALHGLFASGLKLNSEARKMAERVEVAVREGIQARARPVQVPAAKPTAQEAPQPAAPMPQPQPRRPEAPSQSKTSLSRAPKRRTAVQQW